ncbi:tetratricopeptide repeat protein [bacterium]|nr:tetratricopeptide repeat protein [bacterium]
MSALKEFNGLKAYLPQHLVRDPAGGAGVLRGAFLFADISGFTALSEKFSVLGAEGAERIAREISGCFEPLLEIIDREAGSVLRFGGDALLVYFAESGGAARRARAAAEEMLRHVKSMKAVQAPSGSVRLGIKVALHAGSVLGSTVDLGGGRKEYVTLGSGLNELARLESTAARGEIVSSGIFDKCMAEHTAGGEPRSRNSRARAVSADRVRWMAGFLPEAVAARQAILGARTEWMAEMRRITVLFLNVEGLGPLADRAVRGAGAGETPDARICARIESYFSGVRAAAARHGGFFFASDLYDHGDKIILVFGAPVSYERDEERAIDAAREILRLPAAVGLRLRQRIGVNTGQAFCGLVGGPRRRVYTIMGDTVNTAARCMSAAGWSDLYVHETTFALTRGRFEGPRRTFAAKGKSEPVPVRVVRREQASLSVGSATQLIGRDAERREIEMNFSAGKGFLLHLFGEAGVGKSTLLRFAVDRWISEGGRAVTADCLPFGATAPFFPWRRALWNYFRLGADPAPAEILRSLKTAPAKDISFLTEIMGLNAGPRPPRLEPGEAMRRRKEVLRRILDSDRRVLWVFEDIHWMDANSADVFREITAGKMNETAHPPSNGTSCAASGTPPSVAAHVILTGRSEQFPGDQIPRLHLKPFDIRETETLAGLLLGTGVVKESALKDIHARTGGNPFYLTEIFRLIRERGADTVLPDSIGALLHSRVDAVPEIHRQVLRAAAVFGKVFWLDLLAAVSPIRLPMARIREVLGHLETGGFVHPLDQSRFEFRHALTQEAIYEALPAGLRRNLHCGIAERLERRKQPNIDLLAFHYDRAGVADKAVVHLDAAGRRAEAVYANADAIAYYSRALFWAQKTGPDRTRADLHARRAEMRKNVGQFVQARADYIAAERFHLKTGDRVGAARARDSVGICLQREGRHAEARRHSETALRRLRGIRADAAVAKCLNSLTVAHWYTGAYRQAISCGEESIRIRRRLKDPLNVARGLFSLGNSYAVICDFPKAMAAFTELRRISKQIRDISGVAYALDGLGKCHRQRGEFGDAIRLHRESFRIREKIGNRRSIVYSCLNEAAVYLSMRLHGRAIPCLDRAAEYLKETDEENLVGELWRYRGLAALGMNHFYRAVFYLERARRIAEVTGFLESEVKALAPLASVTGAVGDSLRAAGICDRLAERARAAQILDYAAWSDIIAGDIAVRQNDYRTAEESWRSALAIAEPRGLRPILLDISERWRNRLPGRPAPDPIRNPESLVEKMSETLDPFDRQAFESRWRVLLG